MTRGSLLRSRPAAWALAAIAIAAAIALAGRLLPDGVPAGVLMLGAVDGALYALTALGLVLIYRSQRIVNFAQAEIGAMAVAVAVVMVSVHHENYFLALAIGLVAALVTGAIVHLVVEWRFKNAPRMILTVATIGIAQLVGALEIGLPVLYSRQVTLISFSTPFHWRHNVSNITFTMDHVLAIAAAVVCGAGLWAFLTFTATGIAIRGAADSRERAQLLGIPVRRLSLITWMVAAGLSAVGAMAAAPASMGNPPDLAAVAGPVSLLPPLAAAVVGRMESLSVSAVAAILIGVFQQATFWSYPRSSVVDVGLFVVILVALIVNPPRRHRADVAAPSTFVQVRGARPVPAALGRLPEVRVMRRFVPVALCVLLVVVPALAGQRVSLPFAYMVVYGIITVSLVLLSGWAGQISLGQSGFAGIGAAFVGLIVVHAHVDLFVALLLAALLGAVFSALVGIPALRMPGLFLSVATLAFAVPVDTFVLNGTHFPALNPSPVIPPFLFGHFDMQNVSVLYVVAAVVLVALVVAVRNVRSSRLGRALLAVRDNEAAAAAYGISPVAVKLAAFALAGALAGVAGGILVVLEQGSGNAGFDPELSFTLFIGVVVGGLGSLSGAIYGAMFIGLAQYYLSGWLSLMIQGFVVLAILTVFPEGLGGIASWLRDQYLLWVARRRRVDVPSLVEAPVVFPSAAQVAEAAIPASSVLSAHGIGARYGTVEVLFGVDAGVAGAEILALLGTNGAGKSTVLRVLSGLMRPTSGYVRAGAMDITAMSPEERVREGLVMVPGGRGVFPSLTVEENLRLASWVRRHDRAFLAGATKRVHELFPVLVDRMHVEAGALSGGEQQMLTIAQALLCRPTVLLIDELSLGLAPLVVAELVDVVRTMRDSGVTVVVVEQSVNVASMVADRAVFLERGQVRFAGPLAELVERGDLVRSVFLGSQSAMVGAAPGAAPAGARPSAGMERDGTLGAPAQVPAASTEAHAAGEPAAFSVRSASKHFGGVMAVDGVSISVGAGEIHGIIGANGAGKTTLFDICSGFARPDEGSVVMGTTDVTHLPPFARSRIGLGRVFQHAALFGSLTVAETLHVAYERFLSPREPVAALLHLPVIARQERALADRCEELLETLHLERWRDAFVAELSTGTRRVVELACVLAHRPKVVLLDEPSSGLAQREAESLGALLRDVRDRTGAALVVIEHDVPLISSIADSLTAMSLGRVIAEGPPAAVLSEAEVIASFLGGEAEAIHRSEGAVRLPSTVEAAPAGMPAAPG